MKRQYGMTLIEVLLVAVIVAILAMLASSWFSVNKGRRSAAQAFMMEIANREQQYLLDARSYATDAAALSTLRLTTPAEVAAYYAIAVSPGASTPSFVITATPSGAQAADGALTLDSSGAKTRNGNPGW